MVPFVPKKLPENVTYQYGDCQDWLPGECGSLPANTEVVESLGLNWCIVEKPSHDLGSLYYVGKQVKFLWFFRRWSYVSGFTAGKPYMHHWPFDLPMSHIRLEDAQHTLRRLVEFEEEEEEKNRREKFAPRIVFPTFVTRK